MSSLKSSLKSPLKPEVTYDDFSIVLSPRSDVAAGETVY